jgi:hypothetical protein
MLVCYLIKHFLKINYQGSHSAAMATVATGTGTLKKCRGFL